MTSLKSEDHQPSSVCNLQFLQSSFKVCFALIFSPTTWRVHACTHTHDGYMNTSHTPVHLDKNAVQSPCVQLIRISSIVQLGYTRGEKKKFWYLHIPSTEARNRKHSDRWVQNTDLTSASQSPSEWIRKSDKQQWFPNLDTFTPHHIKPFMKCVRYEKVCSRSLISPPLPEQDTNTRD